MKKYFTKYLPVEGEIKEGDMLPDGYGGFFKATEFHVGFNSKPSPPKVHKLMLCSRDIQVGDKFIHPKWNHSTLKEGIDIVANEEDLNYLKEQNCFKVMGEISPDAIWVKEGQEFDEDDVRGWHCGKDEEFGFPVDINNKTGWLTHIHIKGPCGHFH